MQAEGHWRKQAALPEPWVGMPAPLELELSSWLQGEALKMPFTHLPREESGTDGATYRDVSQET